MGKVKEQIVLMVEIPDYPVPTPVIIGYEDIWTTDVVHWRFQTWFDWCKEYVNVEGRFCKDGRMSLLNIHASTSRLAETFYYNPSQCEPIRHFWIDSYK